MLRACADRTSTDEISRLCSLSKKVVAVYDIPPGAVKGAKLEVKDLFSDSRAAIRLGL